MPLNRQDLEMSWKMTTMWTNFVKFGDPTPPGDNLELRWDPIISAKDVRYAIFITGLMLPSDHSNRYLTIDTNLTMGLDEDYITRMAFWDSIF